MWSDRDLALALQLQEQFNREQIRKSPKKNDSNEKLNLGNEDLELIDPTPDVHALFVQFDKKFFWSSLSSVIVRWSKRMYSCAGICRYQGRGGFCDIALSEPLLKLRPRKNLIETLLHEMIHAYLFLTQKDRDRDGHGPNFQFHMHRINKEANINITIYHSFSDEVQLYKVHWWRCNGICQNHKPFYGIVRRSSNRAPGPNDFWWQRHKNICGGSFIKIKEPVKLNKKKPTLKKVEKKAIDIRNFWSPKKPTGNQKLKSDPIAKNEPPSKIIKLEAPLNDLSKTQHEKHKNSISTLKTSTPDLYESLPKYNNQIMPLKTTNILKKYLEANNSPTNDNNQNNKNQESVSKSPEVLKKDLTHKIDSQGVADTVRNHWCNKYLSKEIQTNSTGAKKSISFTNPANFTTIDLTISNSPNKTDINHKSNNVLNDNNTTNRQNSLNSSICIENEETKYFNCPICNILIMAVELNNHLDNCLKGSDFNEFNDISKKSDNNFNDDEKNFGRIVTKEKSLNNEPSTSQNSQENFTLTPEEQPSTSQNIKPCPLCENEIKADELEDHLENCLNNSFVEVVNTDSSKTSIISLFDSDDELDLNDEKKFKQSVNYVPCPCCCELIDENYISEHIEGCLILE